MYLTFYGISISIFLVSVIVAMFLRKKRKTALVTAFVGVLVATGFLVFPLYSGDNVDKAMDALFYVLDLPKFKGSFGILKNAPEDVYTIYRYTLYLYSFLVPILTAGVLFTFIEKFVYEVRSRRRTFKDVYIISEINTRSVTFMESVAVKGNSVIMCDCDGTDKKEYMNKIKSKKAIVLKKKVSDIDLTKYMGKIRIYECSKDENKNLNETLEIIESEKKRSLNKVGKKDIQIYVFSTEEEAQIILDSTEKGSVKTTIINENEQEVYKLLDEVPLYTNAENKHIEVLVVGAGRLGREFIRAVLWCGQMVGYSLKVNVIDNNATRVKEVFEIEYPELTRENYNIEFYNGDMTFADTYKTIKEKFSETNYIIVTLGDDSRNLDAALDLKRCFLQIGKKPVINLEIENEEKSAQVAVLKNERGMSFDLKPFGNIKSLYGKENILNEKIEERAIKLHLSYDSNDTELKRYNSIEYNKRASRSSALHIKYKLYSIFGEETEDLERIDTMLADEKILEKLARNEHDRWNAYTRAMGYRTATIEQVKNYLNDTGNNHVYHLAKMHPCLIEFDKLDNLSRELEKLTGKEYHLKESDYDVVKGIKNILS